METKHETTYQARQILKLGTSFESGETFRRRIARKRSMDRDSEFYRKVRRGFRRESPRRSNPVMMSVRFWLGLWGLVDLTKDFFDRFEPKTWSRRSGSTETSTLKLLNFVLAHNGPKGMLFLWLYCRLNDSASFEGFVPRVG